MIPELGKYAGTVLWAYGVSLALIACIVALSWVQAARTRRRLRTLEERLKRNG